MKKFRLVATTLFLTVHGATVFANQAHHMLAIMSEAQRENVFSNYMHSSGESCSVSRTFYQGAARNGDVFWNFACTDGRSWVIQISNDAAGSARLLECSVLEKIDAGECFKRF